MSLWNPRDMLPGRRSPDGESGGFDPTGASDPPGLPTDPLDAGGAWQSGDWQSGADVPGDPPRRPIGFAPSEDRQEATGYPTGFSFGSSRTLPRANATPDAPHEGPRPEWPTPDLIERTGGAEPAPGPAEDDPVPFYKREIGLRRAKEPGYKVVGVPASDEASDESGPESAEESVPFYKREIGLRRAKAPGYTIVEAAAEAGAPEEDVASGPASEQAVPFYKRELSFRRRKSAETEVTFSPAPAVEAREEAATPVDEEPFERASEPSVPFYKRELSFRRKGKEAAAESEPEHGAIETPIPYLPAETPPAPTAPTPDETFGLTERPAAATTDVPAELTPDHAPAAEAKPPLPAAPEPEPAAWTHVAPVAETVAVPEPEPAAWTHVAPVAETVAVPEPEVIAEREVLPVPVPAPDPVPEAEVAAGAEPEVAAEADAAPAPDGRPADDAVAPKGRRPRRPRGPDRRASDRRRGRGPKGKKVVGLKIGASQIAAAVVVETQAGHEVVKLARRSLAAGIVVDGEVRDEAALASAVKALFDEEKIPRRDVRIGLSSNRIGVRALDIVGIDDGTRFENAIRFKAHEVLPVALDESLLDYRVLETRQLENGDQVRRVLLVVAPRDQVEPYQRVAVSAGVQLTGIDLEALALLRAFVEPDWEGAQSESTATVVVAIGHESSTLLVSGHGACHFTRVFDWGGETLEDAITSSLNVPAAEAATMLRHLSLSGPGRRYDALGDAERAQATEAVRSRLTPFARELVNSLQFYQTQPESLGIGSIVITGGTSHLEGIGEALHQMIGVDVSVGDPLGRVICNSYIDPEIELTIGSMAVAIGLGIDEFSPRGVNLLPKDAIPKKTSRRGVMIAVGAPIAAAVPVLALGLLFVDARGKVANQQQQLDAVEAQLAVTPVQKPPAIDTSMSGDEQARATAVANLLGGRVAWDSVFHDLALVLPENVWLTNLSLKQPDAASTSDVTQPAANPTAVSIEGFTYTQPDVARLLARLATLPSLQRVTLTTSEAQLLGTKDVVHFTVVADLSTIGGAS